MDSIVIKATSPSTGFTSQATIYLIPTVAIASIPTTIVSDRWPVRAIYSAVTGTGNTSVTFSIPDGAPGTIQNTGLQIEAILARSTPLPCRSPHG